MLRIWQWIVGKWFWLIDRQTAMEHGWNFAEKFIKKHGEAGRQKLWDVVNEAPDFGGYSDFDHGIYLYLTETEPQPDLSRYEV